MRKWAVFALVVLTACNETTAPHNEPPPPTPSIPGGPIAPVAFVELRQPVPLRVPADYNARDYWRAVGVDGKEVALPDTLGIGVDDSETFTLTDHVTLPSGFVGYVYLWCETTAGPMRRGGGHFVEVQ